MPVADPTILTALGESLAREPGRPLVTFYDGSTSERIELSVVTFVNWVNKIANLFQDELMLDPGDRVQVDLPPHWQSGITIMGAWTAGLTVSLGASGAEVAATVVGPRAAAGTDEIHGQVIACSLRPMGGPFTEPLPAGWLDFAREVPPQPDALMGAVHVAAEDDALDLPTGTSSHAELLRQARGTADRLELGPGGRLITDANQAAPSGLIAALISPVLVAASVVLVTNCDTGQRDRIAAQEQVTSRFWLTD